jgi:hypothetical protein
VPDALNAMPAGPAASVKGELVPGVSAPVVALVLKTWSFAFSPSLK